MFTADWTRWIGFFSSLDPYYIGSICLLEANKNFSSEIFVSSTLVLLVSG